MRCQYKTFKKIKLCPSDLTHLVRIAERSITGDHPDATEQRNTRLTEIQQCWMACETWNAYAPVQGLTTSKPLTHVFYARFFDITVQIDKQVHTLVYDDVNYRIDSIENLGELNETLAIYCERRGNENEGRA